MFLQGPGVKRTRLREVAVKNVVRTDASLCPSGGQWPTTEHNADGIRARGKAGVQSCTRADGMSGFGRSSSRKLKPGASWKL
jgi:hypothetical protein